MITTIRAIFNGEDVQMKKNLYIGFAALAALTLSACQKEVQVNDASTLVTITLTADKAGDQTRAAVVEGETKASYEWTNADKQNLKLFTVATTMTEGDSPQEVETLTPVENPTIAVSADNRVLSITASVEAGSKVRAVVSSDWTSSKTDPKPRLLAIQKPAVDNFDPDADILVADDVTVDSGLEEAKLSFHRPVTVNKMTLKGLADGEKVSKVVLSSEKHLTGYYDYADAAMSGQQKELTIKYEEPATIGASGELPVYFVTMPNAGHKLGLVVETVKNSKNYRYTFEFPSINFTQGKFSRFSVDLDGMGQEVVDVDYSGEWVIAGTHSSHTFAATAWESGYIYPASEVTVDGEVVTVTGSKDPYKMTIARVADGTYAGLYTIVDANGHYLSATGGTSNNNLTGLESPEETSYWTIAKNTDGTFDILADKLADNARKSMRVNWNNGSPRVTCYAMTSSQPKVVLYSFSKVVEKAPTPTVEYKFKKVSAVTSGKKYLMVGYKENVYHAAVLWTGTKAYGYMNSKVVTPTGDIIVENNLDNAITITTAEGGYSLQMSNGKYIYASGDYATLNYGTEPESVWTITPNSDGTFEIKSLETFIQYGEGTFTTFLRYASLKDGAVMPYLYELDEQGGTTTSKAITFTQPTQAGCSIAVSVDGSAITSGATVAAGKTVTLTATVGTGFTFGSWNVTGATVAAATATTTTFTMGASEVTVSASFNSGGTPTGDSIWEDDFSTCELSTVALTALSGSTSGFTEAYSDLNAVYPMAGAIRVGKASAAGNFTTPVLAKISGSSANLTITFKAAGWKGKTAKLTISASKGSVTEGQTTITSEETMSNTEPSMTGTVYTFHVTGADNTTKLTFSTTNSIGIDDLVIKETN